MNEGGVATSLLALWVLVRLVKNGGLAESTQAGSFACWRDPGFEHAIQAIRLAI